MKHRATGALALIPYFGLVGLTTLACNDATNSPLACNGPDCFEMGVGGSTGPQLPDQGVSVGGSIGAPDALLPATDIVTFIDVRVTPEECPTRNNGVCDEPGNCAVGTDPEDCAAVEPECVDETDCGEDEVCNQGKCVAVVAGCDADNDCAAHQHCNTDTGECVADAGCQSDDDCPANQTCNVGTGVCVADPGPACETDNDCAAGMVCSAAGECVEDAGGECQRSADCPAGMVCEAGACVPPGGGGDCVDDADCALGEVCSGGVCTPGGGGECMDDTDCPAGQICDPMWGMCTDPGAGGCMDDADCPAGQICDAFWGMCTEPGGGLCLDDIDCAAGEMCDWGSCVPAFCEYENDGECDVPEYCPEGTDLADCGGVACIDDQDCAAGQICQGGACVVDGGDFCPYEDDGECDVPEYCPEGTDLADCGGALPGEGEGAPCGASNDFMCADGLYCITGANDEGSCWPECNANAENDCGAGRVCVALEDCNENQNIACDGFCFADDGCTPANAAQVCGGDAYCDVFAGVSACMTPGPGAAGDPCESVGSLGCEAGLVCVFGECNLPCGAGDACGAPDDCVDLSSDLGTDLQVCLETCDVFAGAGCGAGQSCVLGAALDSGLVGLCAEVADGDAAPGEDCVSSADNYWGTCTAQSFCTAFNPAGVDETCVAMCDSEHTDACPVGSGCLLDITGAPNFGVCAGNCSVMDDNCDGNTCTPWGVGAQNDIEVLVGFCSNMSARTEAFDDCQPFASGDSDCVLGTVCSEAEEEFSYRCLPVCAVGADSPYPCPAGSECVEGAFEYLSGEGPSRAWGLCLRN